MSKIKSYKTATSLGKGAKTPEGYHRITVHMVFDVKASGVHKARLVAAGNQAPEPNEPVSSSVASLAGLRTTAFLGALNGLSIWSGDIGNAYLEATTKEKIVFVAGGEWGDEEGHLMRCDKALYGLATSGLRFHEKLSADLRKMGWVQCKALTDVWMRDQGDHYEYLVVYVDDIIYCGKEPESFFNSLQDKDEFGYTLKDVGPVKFHLGADFYQDGDGTHCYGSTTYAKRFLEHFEYTMGGKPTKRMAPMEKGYRPELDTSPECSEEEKEKYQSILGAMQWMVSLGRYDINHAVMSMSRFRAMPRKGHLEALVHLAGYIRRFPNAAIRFRTGIPDHEAEFGKPQHFSWMETPYGDAKEEIPEDAPEPKGKAVRSTSFVDANLLHDVVTGRSCTGIFHFLNQTPLHAFSKRQNQVETATYGSEFMAARQAVEQIIELRHTLRYLGVPLDGPAWLFGDNQSVVNSSTLPYSTLSKRWNVLSYCKCREAIAAGIVRFEHIPGTENPADILTKALPHTTARKYVEPMFFWKGDTKDIGNYDASAMNEHTKGHQSTMAGKHEGSDGNHIPPHGPKGAGSKGSGPSPEWQVVNRAKRKWASVWRPIATDTMSLEAMTTDRMYTTEVYKSVTVNEDSSEEHKNAAPEVGILGEVGSGTDAEEFEEDWSQKWIQIENSV